MSLPEFTGKRRKVKAKIYEIIKEKGFIETHEILTAYNSNNHRGLSINELSSILGSVKFFVQVGFINETRTAIWSLRGFNQ